MQKLKLTRNVSKSECPGLDRALAKGDIVYRYTGATHGCISPYGIAACIVPHGPFFEISPDAVEVVENERLGFIAIALVVFVGVLLARLIIY